MKSLLASLALIGVVVLAVYAASPADFAGTWVLDKAKSEGLPQNLQNADSIAWVITVDDKILKLDVQGGRGPQSESYRVDGKESTEDVAGRMPGKATRKLTLMGNMIELKSVVNAEFNGNAVTLTTVRHLEVAEDHKTLKVHQESENPRGKNESKLVFSLKQ